MSNTISCIHCHFDVREDKVHCILWMTLSTLDDRIRIPDDFDPAKLERQSEISKMKFS